MPDKFIGVINSSSMSPITLLLKKSYLVDCVDKLYPPALVTLVQEGPEFELTAAHLTGGKFVKAKSSETGDP